MPGRIFLVAALGALALDACAAARQTGPDTAVPLKTEHAWRTIATRDDRRRISDWRKAWIEALKQARAGHGAEVAAEGALFEPDLALTEPSPPPGDYRCRTLKLGAGREGMLDYVAYPAFRCRISAGPAGTLLFEKLDGSQRPAGRIFQENNRRMVLLGTLQLGDEKGTLRYGQDEDRDVAAVLERIGNRRWRLAFPYPHFESKLDVVELIPAG